ncbi:MAG: hypothetical protein AAFX06_28885 [Planctomycetota bacterium]
MGTNPYSVSDLDWDPASSSHMWCGRMVTVRGSWNAKKLWLNERFFVTIDDTSPVETSPYPTVDGMEYHWTFRHDGRQVDGVLSLPYREESDTCHGRLSIDGHDLGPFEIELTGKWGQRLALPGVAIVTAAAVCWYLTG